VLDRAFAAVQLGKERPTGELDCDRLILKRTFEQSDNGGAARAVLGVGGISYPRQVPSVLDEHVLKATSSAYQRDVLLARLPHNLVGRLRISVWAARPNDDGRPRGCNLGSVPNRVGAYNPHIDGNPSIFRRMLERGEGRAMVPMIGLQIYQYRDHDGAHQCKLAAKRDEFLEPGF
jgi:hypothetical protein